MVLGGASSAGGLTLLPLARPGRPRRRAAPARDRLRPPARRHRAAALYRTSARRHPTSAVTPRPTGPGRPAGGLAGPHRALRPVAHAQRAARSAGARPLRVRRDAVRAAHGAPLTTNAARALLAGTAAHSMEPLTAPLTSAFGLLLTALGLGGLARGGGRSRGHHPGSGQRAAPPRWRGAHRPPVRVAGRVAAGARRAPRHLTHRVRRAGRDAAVTRAGRPWARFKPGAGTCKVDWALDGPVPWAAEACRRTATVHVGGTFDEVARAEAAVQAGRHAEQPFVLVAQPCVVDPTAGAGGQAHAVGLLPRAERLVGRHDRTNGGADRRVRAGLP